MESAAHQRHPFGWITRKPLLRTALYYVVLGVALLVLRQYAPELYRVLSAGELPRSSGFETITNVKKTLEIPSEVFAVGVVTLIGMTSTFLLMVPVVWIYAFTRQKRGYQQSLVQTLVMLPIVVAAVVILVKNSVALAFSLGGIVGAVSFRNRLQDTKDAIYIFLAIATGLSCGVEVATVALALTVFFNAIMLVLWYTDFGRVPAQLQAGVAQRRLDLAREMVGEERKHSGEFVSVLDQQILQSMTPDQLEALADRALKRQRKLSSALDTDQDDKDKHKDKEHKFDGVLRLTLVDGATIEGVREVVERFLALDAKDWRFEQGSMSDGLTVLRYSVRCRKTVPRPLLLETARRALLNQAKDVGFE